MRRIRFQHSAFCVRVLAIIYPRITDTIGRTPIVHINRLAPEGVDMYVK
jgi:hypothetical protein